MPNPNAIVSSRIRVQPLDEAAREQGQTVELDDERRVRLDPADARSAGFARILSGLRELGTPVYLEVDPATDAITRLLIPVVARVVDIRPVDGGLAVALDASQARHLLPSGDEDAPELERSLRAARESGRPMVITEDDQHRILDVRAFTPDPEGPLPPFPPVPLPRPPGLHPLPWPLLPIWRLICWLWWWICYPWWWWFRCLSPSRAQQVFDAMSGTTCAPLSISAPCIPFLYPDDGCWGRAHEMCRLMIGMGLSPRKVWIDASTVLHVNTRNNPNCYVEWGWHVAPTLCVRGPGFFQSQRMVIDPSLFTTPVTEAAWKGVQGDPGATLTDTSADQFWHGGGTDPTYAQSNAVLATYRLQLQNRVLQFGPPPYANCP